MWAKWCSINGHCQQRWQKLAIGGQMMAKYQMIINFEVIGEGSFDSPYTVPVGTEISFIGDLIKNLKRKSAFVEAFGQKYFVREEESGEWSATLLTADPAEAAVSEDRLARWIEEGFAYGVPTDIQLRGAYVVPESSQ